MGACNSMKKKGFKLLSIACVSLILVSCRNIFHKSPFLDELSRYKNDMLFIDMWNRSGTIKLYDLKFDFRFKYDLNGEVCWLYTKEDVGDKIKKDEWFWYCSGEFSGEDLKLKVIKDEAYDFTGRTIIVYRYIGFDFGLD